MAKVAKDKKKSYKKRSSRESSVESTFSKEGSVAGDELTEQDNHETEMTDIEENAEDLNADFTKDSSGEQNTVNKVRTPKLNKGSKADFIEFSSSGGNVVNEEIKTLKLNKVDRYVEECYQQENVVNQSLEEKMSNNRTRNLMLFIVPALIVGIVAIITGLYLYCPQSINLLYPQSIEEETSKQKSASEQLKTTILEIKNNFPTQEKKLWYQIFSGIKYVNESNPTRPAVFVLLHKNNSDVADCLAWNIGKAASQFFKTTGMIEVQPEDAKDYTNNDLITLYKNSLKSKGVMIVYKLDQLSGLVAKSFHSFCDTYNPLVNRAVLLFTFNDRYANESMIANKRAKKLMTTLWKNDLYDSTLDALITRLTDTVLEVNSEKMVACPQN